MRLLYRFLPVRLALLCLVPFTVQAGPELDAPDFPLPTSAYSQATTLHALSREKWVYLDFWASWCGPCRHSFPFMSQLQQQLKQQGLVVIAVNVDSDKAKAEQFLRDNPADFSVVYDPDGAIAERYHVPVMPTSYLIHDGKIIGRHVGFRAGDSQSLRQQIVSLLQQ